MGRSKHLAGLRTVLEQLQNLAPVDDRPGVVARFFPTVNGLGSTWDGKPPLCAQVGEEVAGPAPQTPAAGLDRP